MAKLVLTDQLRSSLKRPLGKLLHGSSPEVYQEIAATIASKKPPRVILVGDCVAKRAAAERIPRDVMIIDNKEERARTKPLDARTKRVFRVRNKAGTIGSEPWAAVEEAIESGDATIIVEGEEDLLALVAIAVAPLGSFVIYGQPREGIVLVEVDEAAKNRAWCLLEDMRRSA